MHCIKHHSQLGGDCIKGRYHYPILLACFTFCSPIENKWCDVFHTPCPSRLMTLNNNQFKIMLLQILWSYLQIKACKWNCNCAKHRKIEKWPVYSLILNTDIIGNSFSSSQMSLNSLTLFNYSWEQPCFKFENTLVMWSSVCWWHKKKSLSALKLSQIDRLPHSSAGKK